MYVSTNLIPCPYLHLNHHHLFILAHQMLNTSLSRSISLLLIRTSLHTKRFTQKIDAFIYTVLLQLGGPNGSFVFLVAAIFLVHIANDERKKKSIV